MKHITSKKIAYFSFFVIVTIVALNGCNLAGTKASNIAKTGISFVATTSASSSPAVAPSAFGSDSGTVAATTGLQIDTAKVLIKKLEFHSATEDSLDFEQGPLVLTLNLDSTVTNVAIDNVPHGLYSAISFEIHKPRPNETVTDSDFVAGPKEDQRYSVVVKGFYNGTHFVFKSHRSAEVHIKLNPPLNISDSLSSYNATVKVDVSQWFVDQNGNIIDPTNPNNEEAISQAIRRSFHAFEDNNHDGHDDHTESGHGGDHSGSHH